MKHFISSSLFFLFACVATSLPCAHAAEPAYFHLTYASRDPARGTPVAGRFLRVSESTWRTWDDHAAMALELKVLKDNSDFIELQGATLPAYRVRLYKSPAAVYRFRTTPHEHWTEEFKGTTRWVR